MDTFSVLALGGDGIGPEVLSSALAVLDVIAAHHSLDIKIREDLLHGAAWDAYGTFCRDETLDSARHADAVLVGAVGGEKWDQISVPGGPEMQDGLMRLRKELDAFVGLRPAKSFACLEHLTPFRAGLVTGADVMVMREMCGGVMFGEPRGIAVDKAGERTGLDSAVYTEQEISRFAQAGFQLAQKRDKRLCSTDKSNVMESGVLWRKIVDEVSADYPDVSVTHLYTDNLSYQLVRDPKAFDLILADNLFGDILSDQCGAIAGSLGMLPSACLREAPQPGVRCRGIFEPVHGTAPTLVGKDAANPVGMILSLAMMFEFAMGREDIAKNLESAVIAALEAGFRTQDIGGKSSMSQVTQAIAEAYVS